MTVWVEVITTFPVRPLVNVPLVGEESVSRAGD